MMLGSNNLIYLTPTSSYKIKKERSQIPLFPTIFLTPYFYKKQARFSANKLLVCSDTLARCDTVAFMPQDTVKTLQCRIPCE